MGKQNRHNWGSGAVLALGMALALSASAQNSPDILWEKQANSDRINSVTFSSDGSMFVTGSSDRLINFWNVADGTLLRVLNSNAPPVHESAIESVSITSDGSRVASGSYRVAKLWHMPQGTVQNLAHNDWVVNVAFSPNGALLATASFDGFVRIWRSSDGTLIRSIAVGSGQMRAVAFSPDGSYLTGAGGGDFGIRIWNTANWSLVRVQSGHVNDIYDLAFSPNGQYIASGGYDQTVKVWNFSDGSLRYTLPGAGQFSGRTYSVSFSPDSTLLAFTEGEGNIIRLARVSDGAILRTYTQNVEDVEALAFSPSGLLGYGHALSHSVVMSRVSTTPVATITSPANGTTFTAPASITFSANPSKSSGIVRMDFYQGSTRIASDTTAPYTFRWANVPAGNYVLTVVDTDSRGAQTRSGPINISVVDPAGPQVSMTSPDDGSSFTSPANITLSANASAGNGVTRVEFFQNGSSLGSVSSAPYALTWNNIGNGNYSLTAVVTDTKGQTATAGAVNISVRDLPPESTPPRVAITFPVAGARVTGSPLTVRGAASDNVEVARVLYSLNGGEIQVADGTTSWTANLNPVAGLNTLAVKSVDVSGNESAVATRAFTYVVTSTLGVEIDGNGILTPNLNGHSLEVGKPFAMTAVPSAGYIFNGWHGGANSDSPRLLFTMQEGMSLQASFIPNPFIPVRGVYRGLIHSDNATHDSEGFLIVSVASSGLFSARATLGGTAIGLAGQFNGSGEFARTVVRPGKNPVDIHLSIDLSQGTDQITGTISDGNFTSGVSADRAVYSLPANPAPQAGRYTVLIAPGDQGESPRGSGIGFVFVDAFGNARITGFLADGAPFAQAATLSKNGVWPFYVPLYAGHGSISGPIVLRDSGTSDADARVNWFRPPNPAGLHFRDGFATQTTLTGSRFTPATAGSRILNLADAPDNARIALGAGGLDGEISVPATLNTLNQLVPDPNDLHLRAAVAPGSGAVYGVFNHPANGRPFSFRGVVFQKQNFAAGYFLTTDSSGYVTITPAQ